MAILNKVDILPYTNFDLAAAKADIETIHPGAKVLAVSSTTEEGLVQWYDWLRQEVKAKQEEKR